jgi:hypothetical protein
MAKSDDGCRSAPSCPQLNTQMPAPPTHHTPKHLQVRRVPPERLVTAEEEGGQG